MASSTQQRRRGGAFHGTGRCTWIVGAAMLLVTLGCSHRASTTVASSAAPLHVEDLPGVAPTPPATSTGTQPSSAVRRDDEVQTGTTQTAPTQDVAQDERRNRTITTVVVTAVVTALLVFGFLAWVASETK